MPADFLESRQLLIGGKRHDFIPPERYQHEQEMQSTARYFTRIGGSFLRSQRRIWLYSLLYSAAFASLSADSETNWVLTNAQDVYLFCALKHAAVWAKGCRRCSGYDAMYQAAVSKLNSSDRASRFAGALSARVGVAA